MDKTYAKAYTEVLEILRHLPEEEYERIPKTEIQFYENNCDKNYKYMYDEGLKVEQQKISREANTVIISIYMNYFANEKQKGIIEELLKQNSIEEEKNKKEKYSVDNIFENNENKNILSENLPIEVDNKKENFIKKIIKKIKSIFSK